MHRGLHEAFKRRLRSHLAAVRRASLKWRPRLERWSGDPALPPETACFAGPGRTVFAVLHLPASPDQPYDEVTLTSHEVAFALCRRGAARGGEARDTSTEGSRQHRHSVDALGRTLWRQG